MTVHQKGLTIMDLVVSLAIAAIIAASTLSFYREHVIRTQTTEAMMLFEAGRKIIAHRLALGGNCWGGRSVIDDDNYIWGKYGQLYTSGASVATVSGDRKALTGCYLNYNYYTYDRGPAVRQLKVAKQLEGKLISANVHLDGTISKNSATTVDARYLPKSFQ